MIDRDQVEAAKKRFEQRTPRRENNQRLIGEKRLLEIDPPERVEQFLKRRAGAQTGEELFSTEAAAQPHERPQLPSEAAFERMIGTSDLLGVAFLERGLQVAQSVGRIWVSVSSGQPAAFGTGFLVAPRLMLTNNHVLESAAVARNSWIEFDYQVGIDGRPCPTCTFDLDPDAFFVTSTELDFTLVAVAMNGRPERALSRYYWNPLIEAQGKVLTGQWMNIIQHPDGQPKQLCFRENQLVDILDDFLHYKSDTAPGSSGSPVYNDRWEVVGLHHSGVWATDSAGHIIAVDGSVWRPEMGEQRIKWIANEGVRISKIIAHVRAQQLPPQQRQLFEATLAEARPVSNGQQPEETASKQPETRSTDVRSGDGIITMTVPLTVSVQLGVSPAQAQSAAAPASSSRPVVTQPAPSGSAGTNAEILEAARREFRGRADVVDVELGYLFRNGWITNERAIVVTVRDKKAPTVLKESRIAELPDTFMGLPVDVTSPSIRDVIALTQGNTVATEAFGVRPVSRNEITYKPPTGAPLQRTTAKMRVCAHVSPDAGWAELEPFLDATKKSLTVAMYDFGAPHIDDAVTGLSKKSGLDVKLVMQRGESVGSGTKVDDKTDQEVVDDLRASFKTRFQNAWVKIGRVNGWVSSSYHIKVAVRDSSAFWLSSGNWQSSNQAPGHPLDESPQQRSWLDKYNRDWHVIVEHAGLAETYEKYIKHDFDNNVGPAGEEAFELPDLLVPAGFLLPLEAARPFEYFKPFDETRQFTVTPLLTPDNFHERILDLVRSAKTELLIQNQTFNAPGEDHQKLKELIDAVKDRIDAGVDVRVIFRLLIQKDARANLSALKAYGFPTDRIKVQKNCHTKGIIVDGETVVLGSQNWSNDGVSVNRDASLLFEDADLATYYRNIFEHDWKNQATQNIGAERGGVRVASRNETTPPGMIRLSWKDYMEMQ